MMIVKVENTTQGEPVVMHETLHTRFTGIVHPLSTPEAPVYQYLGIKYASVPARFRQSRLFSSFPPDTDATILGPICPQSKFTTLEQEVFGLPEDILPQQIFSHDEFECLNLNITCPGNTTALSHLPVMLWTHGGGNCGSGSSWLYDGGAFVQKSIEVGKPVVLVTINYRLGLLGFASSHALREDNKAAGDEGVGNYGLRDQRKALEWVHSFIAPFGGDPSNVTLFGIASGAADILCHLHSSANEKMPLFQRAIIQSAMLELEVPNVHSAGWQLSRIMSGLHVHTIEGLRAVDAGKLVALGHTMRVTDDGVFFQEGWRDSLYPEETGDRLSTACTHISADGHLDIPELQALSITASRSPHHHLRSSSHSRSRSESRHRHLIHPHPKNLQAIMIGDCGAESLLWTLPASLWNGPGVVRRVRAVCQSLNKSTALLRAYDINAYTPSDELPDRILELINDARFAWPTECIARSEKLARAGHGVWRYVFDQESPSRGVPHHAVDVMYLFDTVPHPNLESTMSPDNFDSPEDSPSHPGTPSTPDMVFGSDSSSEDGRVSPDYGFGCCPAESDDEWGVPIVDNWTYCRVRDAVQSRWFAFAYGEAPWHDDKVYVFGPEGEIGERSMSIFAGRRRTQMWKEALEPLGMRLVQKVGIELSNGPPLSSKQMF